MPGTDNESGLAAQLAVMGRGLKASPTRNTVALLVVALFIVIAATAYGQIRLNGWNQPFYDAVARVTLGLRRAAMESGLLERTPLMSAVAVGPLISVLL
jgi:ABC-type uncharacterized transport system fused permease/ATPase subunit